WWRNYGQGMVEGMTKTMEEAQEYGREADEPKCVNESVARYKREAGITGAIKGRIFLKSCLETSGAAAGFCDGVPAKSEFTRSAEWQREKCEQVGLRDEYCRQLFEEVQDYCGSSASQNKQRPTPAIDDAETPTPTPRRGRAPR
ncbi:MAG: hypothetical protein LC800_06755, partial [Acidobacteria bacterium]|nr:hypothetical protein [Acidobacteriota bacterium]